MCDTATSSQRDADLESLSDQMSLLPSKIYVCIFRYLSILDLNQLSETNKLLMNLVAGYERFWFELDFKNVRWQHITSLMEITSHLELTRTAVFPSIQHEDKDLKKRVNGLMKQLVHLNRLSTTFDSLFLQCQNLQELHLSVASVKKTNIHCFDELKHLQLLHLCEIRRFVNKSTSGFVNLKDLKLVFGGKTKRNLKRSPFVGSNVENLHVENCFVKVNEILEMYKKLVNVIIVHYDRLREFPTSLPRVYRYGYGCLRHIFVIYSEYTRDITLYDVCCFENVPIQTIADIIPNSCKEYLIECQNCLEWNKIK
jgi:hypothetical protein